MDTYSSKGILRGAALVIAGLLAATVAFGQSTTGSFQGTVSGPTGEVIPGVTVTIVNTATGLNRSTVTNASGNYDAPLLPPGTYNISVEVAGFQKMQKTGIQLLVNQTPRVDFTLQISTVQESVTVQAETSLVETQDSALRQVVEQKQIVDLPLNGRSFRSLGLTVPGVADMAQNSNIATRGGGINIVGAKDVQNNFLLDGFDNNDPTTGETLTFPTVDSIQEFAIMGANFGADVGFANGGIVTLVTRSGSSTFHGDAWEFIRNDIFNGRNFFAKTVPPLKRNQFGGTLGGPLQTGASPHLFFFGAYESTIDHEGVTQTATVPTLAMRGGDFSGLAAPIYDPATGLPFKGNQIPVEKMNAVGSAILQQLIPAPTGPGTSQNYVSAPVVPNNLQVGTARADFTQSPTNSYFARYSHYWQTTLDTTSSPFPIAYTQLIKHTYNIGGEWTHVFGPRTVQEVRMGFGHVDNEKWAANQQNWDKLLGITSGTEGITSPNEISGGPVIVNLAGYTGMTPNSNAFIRIHHLWQVAYALTHNVGNHALRIGAEYRHYRMDILDDSNPQGTYTFTGQYTKNPAGVTPASPGNAVADLLLGFPAQTQNLLGPQSNGELNWQLAEYIQDNWRVSRKLTLNLGFRYEYQSPDTAPDNLMGAFVPSLGKAVQAGTNGLPAGIRNQYYKNFAPRLGFAWDLTGKGRTVIRAGYGIYYESLIHNIFQPSGFTSAPISKQGVFVASPTTPNISLSNPFPAALANSVLASSGVDPTYHGGRTQRWEAGVQQAIGSHGVVEVAYVGSYTAGEASAYNLNQPPPGQGAVQPRRPYSGYTTITWTDPTGIAKYRALQAKYEHRLSKGFSLLGAYTFAKATDNTQDGVPNQDRSNRAADFGRASFDVRHRLVFSMTYALQFQNLWLRNWQLSTISTFSSGPPVTALLSIDNANVGTTNNQRPNESGDPNSNAPHNAQQWFNTSVFSVPAQYNFGNAPRNDITGPGVESIDLALMRQFRWRERISLELRAEGFDMLNHANFLLPNNTANAPANFGKIFVAKDPREFQFGAKLRF